MAKVSARYLPDQCLALILSGQLCQMGISFTEQSDLSRLAGPRCKLIFHLLTYPSSAESSTDMFPDLLETQLFSDLNFNAFVALS